MKNPLFSIIIPVYNAESYLRECVNSIINQSYSNWELILVDDGSQDKSGFICNEYQDSDERIRVFHKKNGGPSSARNLGLDEAEGDFIVFVDSDDWVSKSFLEDYLAGLDADIVYQGHVKEYDNHSIVVNDLQIDSDICGVPRAIQELWGRDYFGYTCMKCFKREIIEKYHVRFDVSVFFREDTLFTAHYFRYVKRARVIPVANYHYRYIETSLQHTHFRGKELLYVDDKIYEQFSCYFYDRSFYEFVETWYLKNLHNVIKKSYNGINATEFSDEERIRQIEKCIRHRAYFMPKSFDYSKNKVVNFVLKVIWMTNNPHFILRSMRFLKL